MRGAWYGHYLLKGLIGVTTSDTANPKAEKDETTDAAQSDTGHVEIAEVIEASEHAPNQDRATADETAMIDDHTELDARDPIQVQPEQAKPRLVLPLIVGAIAGVGGALAVSFAGIGAKPDVSAQLAPLQLDLASARDQIAAQTQTIDALSQTISDIKADLHAPFDPAALEGRLRALETAPAAVAEIPSDIREAYEAEVQNMRTHLASELARLEAAQAEAMAFETAAKAAAAAAEIAADVEAVRAAAVAGLPFADQLTALADRGVAIPDGLQDAAATGVATLTQLQDGFAAPARKALAISVRETAGETRMERFTAFWKSQLGVRSLEPRQGDDPDAILSRAEAAIRSGESNVALAEIAKLPENGQAAMADWISTLQAREAAFAALADLRAPTNPVSQ